MNPATSLGANVSSLCVCEAPAVVDDFLSRIMFVGHSQPDMEFGIPQYSGVGAIAAPGARARYLSRQLTAIAPSLEQRYAWFLRLVLRKPHCSPLYIRRLQCQPRDRGLRVIFPNGTESPRMVVTLTREIANGCAGEIVELLRMFSRQAPVDRGATLPLCNPGTYARAFCAALMTPELTPQEAEECVHLWASEFAGAVHVSLAECRRQAQSAMRVGTPRAALFVEGARP